MLHQEQTGWEGGEARRPVRRGDGNNPGTSNSGLDQGYRRRNGESGQILEMLWRFSLRTC